MDDKLQRMFIREDSDSDCITRISSKIKTYPDFPKKNVLFYDIFSLFDDPQTINDIISAMANLVFKSCSCVKIGAVVGLESRGFLFGPMLALEFGCGFIPFRKKGKLPGKVVSADFALEYGTDAIECSEEYLRDSRDNFVIVDDLLATGGTLEAANKLLKQFNKTVVCNLVLIELKGLNGRKKVPGNVQSVLQFP